MMKYYLIYIYHDVFYATFFREDECFDFVEHLKQEYKNDPDFSYFVVRGVEIDAKGKNK